MAEIQNLQDINKEELINSVRFYPCLYDKRSIGYKNTQKNNSIWKSIAAENSIETAVEIECDCQSQSTDVRNDASPSTSESYVPGKKLIKKRDIDQGNLHL
ncbi:unnamed protein product [Gordionus sp. m RMFG-2023]